MGGQQSRDCYAVIPAVKATKTVGDELDAVVDDGPGDVVIGIHATPLLNYVEQQSELALFLWVTKTLPHGARQFAERLRSHELRVTGNGPLEVDADLVDDGNQQRILC